MAFGGALLDLLYPRVCGGCGQRVGGEGMQLCWDCLSALQPVVDPFCSHCGDPVEGMIEHRYRCGPCRKDAPGFDRARSAVRYRGPICDALQALKYNGGGHLAADLARLLAACVRTHFTDIAFDAVAFVPLYAKRQRARTYNQSRLLAVQLGRELGLGLMPPRTLKRTRDTGTQTGLTAPERRINVENAFAVTQAEWVEGRVLLLVDDVMTTGATVSACSRAIKEAGAAGVYVVTVARG
ncbi:MAG: ComF family protein [Lentisphaerae bacterium]|nr:ComF family protein [Lentisphaerota bacterium]